jgi:hypothetical protein
LELTLQHNQLSGELPSEIGNLNSLTYLSLYHNQFSGIVPDTICALNALLSLSENQFCPPFPLCFNEENIIQIGLNNQDFSNCSGCEVNIISIDNQQILEDSSFVTEISADSGEFVSSIEFFVYNDPDFPASLDNQVLTITPEENWNGTITTSVYVTNNYNVSDTSTFTIEVQPVNDTPQSFTTIGPESGTYISINPNNMDESLLFTWGQSIDVDDDVIYYSIIGEDQLELFSIDSIYGEEHHMTYVEIIQLMQQEGLSTITGSWMVIANDGEYIVNSDNSSELTIDISQLGLDIIDVPNSFSLHQNHPNPFNPITFLRYNLPEDGMVNITIYDMMGRIVKTLVNSSQTAGFKSVQWNAINNRNEPVSAGLYLYTIQAGEYRQTKKMILLK